MTEDIEDLREKKIEEMQEEEQEKEQQLKQQASKHLTSEARSRMENIRAARPQQASMLESHIAKLGMTGRLQGKISDEELKKMLKELNQKDSDYNIKHR